MLDTMITLVFIVRQSFPFWTKVEIKDLQNLFWLIKEQLSQSQNRQISEVMSVLAFFVVFLCVFVFFSPFDADPLQVWNAEKTHDKETKEKQEQLEIWSQRPMYFAATIAIHHSAARGVALSMGGWCFSWRRVVLFMGGWHFLWGGWYFSWGGVDFGPYLVEGQQGGVASMGGSAKPKVLLLATPLELQYYFAPFSKAAK